MNILQIIRDVFRGVNLLNNIDIVHCDIKTENIFMDHKLVPKVGDLGPSLPIHSQ